MFILKYFWTPIPEPLEETFRESMLIKSRNQNVFEKFKLNQNLQTILFKMMYNMSMLRNRFSNERWGGGGALNHLPLIFCKSAKLLLQITLDIDANDLKSGTEV